MTQNAQSKPDAASDELDPNSLAAIRSLLASEEPLQATPVAQREAAKAARSQAPVETPSEPAPKRSFLSPLAPQAQIDDVPQERSKRLKAPKQPTPQGGGVFEGVKAKLTGYRPTPKHIVLACLALLVLFRPWLVFGLLFLFALVAVGVFLILGYDGFWQQVMRVARWYARKHPSRSAELHRKLDGFALRFDAFLDRFPEGTVDGLYLPDFGELASAEARHDAALERRFENLRDNEAERLRAVSKHTG